MTGNPSNHPKTYKIVIEETGEVVGYARTYNGARYYKTFLQKRYFKKIKIEKNVTPIE
jgi:hypothetical protein